MMSQGISPAVPIDEIPDACIVPEDCPDLAAYLKAVTLE